jgi:hypothetical protein
MHNMVISPYRCTMADSGWSPFFYGFIVVSDLFKLIEVHTNLMQKEETP